MIRRVKDLELGQVFFYDNIVCRVAKFPTRHTIVLNATEPELGLWSTCTTTIRDFRERATRITIQQPQGGARKASNDN